jgi:type IV pilus assembly protein PilY1
MRLSRLPAILLLAALAGAAPATRAEDIDIFGQVATDGIKPNVLIVLDTASSNEADFRSDCPIDGIGETKLMDSVQCAIAIAGNVIRSQPTLLYRINLGLMIYGLGTNPGGHWVVRDGASSALLFMDPSGVDTFVSTVTAGYHAQTTWQSSQMLSVRM